MHIIRSSSKSAIVLLLILSFLITCFTGCQKTDLPPPTTEGEATPNSTLTSTGGNAMYTSWDYVKKYADTAAMELWIKKNIEESSAPPVTFKINGKSSGSYLWEKTEGNTETVIYFEGEDHPSQSIRRTINYTCSQLSFRVEFTLISYTDYPVVEYTAVLYNEAEGNSERISELLSADYNIEDKTGDYILHASRGANTQYNDFEPLSYELTNTKHFEVTNGKPTSTYLPYFNVENRVENTGTISIINWQGNWKADFTKNKTGVALKAGQYKTDLVLQKGESMDFPSMILLFYKGDYINGQNVYRRFLYSCNQFREQGKHMKETNVLVCSDKYNLTLDKKTIDMYIRTGLVDYIDKFNIDGGWYDTKGNTWYYTGNWYPLKSSYPKGIIQLSDAVHDAGMKFAVWFEPERVAWGTATTDALMDMGGLIVVGSDGKAITDYSKVAKGNCEVILDYSNPAVVSWVIDMLNTQFKENNIDQYRQDFNTYPSPHWTALDRTRSSQLGIPRTGYTENKYCKGYLEVYAGILKENPGMYIDACASGGMRNDMSTIRYSFMHTRSDYWADIESAQLQTYGSSMWFMYWGTGFSSSDLNQYDVRSHISNSIGVGISKDSQADALKNALDDWGHLATYLFYDYYPLSGYAGSSKDTMSLQYDSPEDGKGMFITYFRKNDTFKACPRGLDPTASYYIWDLDNKDATITTMTGKQIMEGIKITSGEKTAVVYEYSLVEGEDTTAFQNENVPTGKGSNGYDPEAQNGKVVDVTPPEVSVKYQNVMADSILTGLYNIEGEGQISLIGADHRTTGLLYAISGDIYNELIFTSDEVNGWRAVNKSKIYISIPGGGPYPFTTWNGNGALFKNVQPYAKKIENGYFLWIANILPFADDDGQWKNWDCTISWDIKDGGKGQAVTVVDFTMKDGRITPVGKDKHGGKGKIYKIDQAIYQSFCYTGKGLAFGEEVWLEIDPSTLGIVSVIEKAPAEVADITPKTKWLSSLENNAGGIYAIESGGEYFLWMRDSESLEGLSKCHAQVKRAVFVWKSTSGEINQQGILFPV